jgi:hypothetical protein
VTWARNESATDIRPEHELPTSSVIAPTGNPPCTRSSRTVIPEDTTGRTIRARGVSAAGKRLPFPRHSLDRLLRIGSNLFHVFVDFVIEMVWRVRDQYAARQRLLQGGTQFGTGSVLKTPAQLTVHHIGIDHYGQLHDLREHGPERGKALQNRHQIGEQVGPQDLRDLGTHGLFRITHRLDFDFLDSSSKARESGFRYSKLHESPSTDRR